MVKEKLKKPCSENVLNMFENTELKFFTGMILDCCFPRLNREKKKKDFSSDILLCMGILKLPFWLMNYLVLSIC